MAKLKQLVADGLEPGLLHETTGELLELVQVAVAGEAELDAGARLLDPGELEAYAAERHAQRMRQIIDSSTDIPNLEELTALEAGDE